MNGLPFQECKHKFVLSYMLFFGNISHGQIRRNGPNSTSNAVAMSNKSLPIRKKRNCFEHTSVRIECRVNSVANRTPYLQVAFCSAVGGRSVATSLPVVVVSSWCVEWLVPGLLSDLRSLFAPDPDSKFRNFRNLFRRC